MAKNQSNPEEQFSLLLFSEQNLNNLREKIFLLEKGEDFYEDRIPNLIEE